MTKYVELLKKDLLEKGMISENLPDFINTNGISKIKFKELKKSGKYSSPITINIMKDDGGDRIISLPNPVSYQQLVKTMFSSEKMIKKVIEKIEKNKFSHSKIISDIDQLFDMPIKKNKSNFSRSRREKMFLSIGKRYSLKYDIEKFYDSIYTHYLPAGLVGFSEALNMYRGNKEKSEEYNYMFKIDCDMRNLCNAETKGILTGPYTSRIFSELLQSEIDKEIFNSINNNSMRRFVDDTEIYSYTKEEQERNLENIKKILQKYKLAMKMEKTKIIKFPFIDFSTLRDLINIRFIKNKKKIGWYFACQDDLFEVLNKADKMTQAGNKGTFKYILKVLNGKNFEYGINENYEEKDASFFYLLNYITIYPQYSKEILDLLNVNIQYIDNSQEILNQTLKKFIKNGLDLACLFLIQLMLKNKIDIEEEIMDEYLNSENNNEILRATIINYLCEKNIDKKYDKKLLNEVEKLKIDKKINFSTENWLAKYILYYYNFFEDKDCVEINNFLDNFKQYKNNNIKFIDFNLL